MPAFVRTLGQNWKLKLLATALAVLLWVVVSAEEVTSNWIPVPLQVRVSDPQYRLIQSSLPAEVEVRFSGPGRELWDLVVRRPPLVLSLDDVRGTTETVELEARMVQLPPQLSVSALDVRPGAVTLDFQRVESRLIPVRVTVASGPGAGWTLVDSLTVQPARVRVSGLEAALRDVQAISTAPIAIGPSDSTFSRVVPLDTSELAGVRFSATNVRISGRVDRVLERVYDDVRISVGAGVVVRPGVVDVTVQGPAARVRELRAEDFRVVVSIDSIPIRIPAEGLMVPVRVERLAGGITGVAAPLAVRLLPERAPADSTVLLGRPRVQADTLSPPRPQPR